MKLCVYLGSNQGNRPAYRAAAVAVGEACAQRGWTIVYGGSNKGMMGVLAEASLKAGGQVIGVIPAKLKEWGAAKEDLAELHVVSDMHARKAKMAELSDAFLALPGGIGTFEEVLEAAAWNQLGYHRKPLGLYNVEGYFDLLGAQLDKAVTEGFMAPEMRAAVRIEKDLDALFQSLAAAPPPLPQSKWINP